MDENNTNDLPVDLTDEETIDLFIEGLMDEKGINPESDEMRKDVFNDLKSRLLEEMDRSLISALPDDKLDEFSKMAEENGRLDPEMVAKAISEAGVNTEEVLGVTMAKFREIYLGDTGETEEVESVENTESVEDTGAAEGTEE